MPGDRTRIGLSDITVVGEAEGDSLVVTGAGNVTASGVTGGNGGPGDADYTIWSPDAAPNSPSAYDDEFDDSSFDTGLWTDYDEGSNQTVTEDERGLVLTETGSGTIAGIYQDVPAGAGWSIIAKISGYGIRNNNITTGLMLLDDVANLDTTAMAIWGLIVGGQRYGWAYYTANDYNQTGQAEAYSDKDQPISTYYFRIRTVSTTWYLDFSLDGLGWMTQASFARPWTPTGFGIGKRLDDTVHLSVVNFFRYTTDTDYDDIVYGDRVKRWRG